MNRYTLFGFLWLYLSTFSMVAAQGNSGRPNIVLILADDLGWSDLGCYGSSYYETPNIDRFAAEALRFTDAYSSAPVCAPTRAALMTGKSPGQLRLTAVFDRDFEKMPLLPPNWVKQLPVEEVTLGERFKEIGYTTGIMGKWHLGKTADFWPENQGFDVNVGAWESGRPASYFPPYKNPKISDEVPGEYLTDRIAREAVGFIEDNRDRPFFLYLPFYSPHLPLEAPEETIAHFRGKEPYRKQKNPTYAAMVARLDQAVGAVLKTLDSLDLADNTLVVFTSDNGGVLSLSETLVTDNHPLRAEKFLLYEGGIRVPLIVRWPGIVPKGSKTSQLAVSHDMLPTLLSAAGSPLFDDRIEGVDLLPVFKQGELAKFNRVLTWHYPHYMPRQEMKPSSAIRVGDMKLIHWHESHKLELYDLGNDIGESRNLAKSMPGVAKTLYSYLDDWRMRRGVQMPVPNPAFVEN
ncbi:sulfatase [Cyclobacterium xiamenense]|uniref:sulfatase n=1 Tax=Cyclobacterium xiamenense TaxID=1297121 RepID=UPI0012B72DA7|nr:sulfatase [Cyclobacterium xiamenense]